MEKAKTLFDFARVVSITKGLKAKTREVVSFCVLAAEFELSGENTRACGQWCHDFAEIKSCIIENDRKLNQLPVVLKFQFEACSAGCD